MQNPEAVSLKVSRALCITLLANLAICGIGWAGDVIAHGDQASGANSAPANSEDRIGELTGRDPSVSIFDIRYSPDGTMVAAAFYERESSKCPAIIVWDRKSRAVRYRFYTHERKAWCVTFSPDGRLLATGGADGAIRLWDVNTGRLLHECKDSAHVFSVAFSPDGRLLASTNGDYIRWWDTKTLKEYAADAVPLTASGSGLHMARQVPILACGGDHSDVTLINAHSRKVLKRITTGAGDGKIERLTLSSDAAILVVQELNGPATAWDTATAHKKADLNDRGDLCAAMSPDDRLVALERAMPNGIPTGVIELWETLTWTIAKTIRHNQQYIHRFAFSPDSREGVSAGNDGTAVLWDLTGLRSRKPTDRDDLRQLFEELKCQDANRAYPAIWKLVRQGPRAVELFGREVKPQPPAAAWNAEITKLMNDLDSDSFLTRQTATKLLIDKGPSILPLLHHQLASKLSPESAARIKAVIERFDGLTPDALRACRCVAVLEHIGSAEAVRSLRLLASGGPGLVTAQAQQALTRIQNQKLQTSGSVGKGDHAK
jgi:hypothetical protein